VGWPLANWDVLLPLIEDGTLPALAAVVSAGSMAHLQTHAISSVAMAATTLVTGYSPRRHCIVAAAEPDPFSGGARSPQSTSRRTPALWNLCHRASLSSAVIGWPATHPAEPSRGVIITPEFPQPFPRPGSIGPESLESTLASLRVSPFEIGVNDPAFSNAIAVTASIHAAATWAIESQPWDFACVHYPALELAQGLSPRQVHELWRLLDVMLNRLLQLAGPDCVFALVSVIPGSSSRIPLGGDGDDGLLLLKGPGIPADEWLPTATIYDICPTVLAALGLPAAGDMPGACLIPAWTSRRIPALKAPATETGMHPVAPDCNWSAELARLDAQGYPDTASAEALQDAIAAARAQAYSSGCLELYDGNLQEAVAHLSRAARIWGSPGEPHLLLAYLRFLSHDSAGAQAQLAPFTESHPLAAYAAWIRAHILLAAGETGEAESLFRLAEAAPWGKALLRTLEGDYHRAYRCWLAAESAYRAALAESPTSMPPATGLAEILLRTGRDREVVVLATRMLRRRPLHPQAHLWLGIANLRLGEFAAAEKSFETAFRLEPQDKRPAAWLKRLHRRQHASL
jgi:Flp pilus assembly protein TadD